MAPLSSAPPPRPTSVSSPPSGSEPLALRGLHLVLLFGLALIFILFVSLALLSSSSGLRNGLPDMFNSWIASPRSFSWKTHRRLEAFTLILIVLTPILPLLLAWRLGLRSWRLLLMLPVGLLLLGSGWFLHGVGAPFNTGKSSESWILLASLVFVAAVAFFLLWKLRTRSWWWVGGGYLAAAPVLMFLVVDDPILRHPVSIDEIAPAFPGAEKSFEVLMRYGNRHPLGREFKSPQRIFQPGPPAFAANPRQAEEWRDWLLARRTEIEADWADLAPVRAWWIELYTFDRIGDLTPSRFDAEIITFAPLRSYSQHAVAVAGLQALDGHGDEAFATLLPLLEVSRKLEPSARTLVRLMIARTIQRMALDTAGFVLDHATVSAAPRARFAAALAGGSSGEAGARRLLGIDYAFNLGIFLDLRLGDYVKLLTEYGLRGPQAFFSRSAPRHLLNLLSPLIYNPRKTLNLYGDLTGQLQDLAARREPEKMDPTSTAFFEVEARSRFKNLAGPILLSQTVPAYARVAEAYWETEATRAALRERLAKM